MLAEFVRRAACPLNTPLEPQATSASSLYCSLSAAFFDAEFRLSIQSRSISGSEGFLSMGTHQTLFQFPFDHLRPAQRARRIPS